MDRISGIFFREPTSQLRDFNSLQSESGNAFRKVSPVMNAYFHADGRSQHTTVTQTGSDSKAEQHIVWVGTIHNRDEIVRFLSQAGISSDTDTSDAQLVLAMYNLVGHDVSTHLIGYYAFAVWNEPTRSLFLSRDAIGAERLYYFHTPNLFCWGTEIRQVCFLAGLEPVLNEGWMAEALTWSWDGCLAHTQDSPIKGVQAIPPGHNLLLTYGKTPQLTQWWEWEKYKGGKSPKDEDLIEEFRALLTCSVKNCLGTDPRVIADLSGGLDSSSVVSIACHLAEKEETSVQLRDVISYVDPSESRFDDTEYQESVLKRYGLKQHKFSLDGLWYLQGIRDQDAYFDYPTPVLLWLNLISAPAKFSSENGFVISLTGAGGDNIIPPISIYLFDYVRAGNLGAAWKDIAALSAVTARPIWKTVSDNVLLPIKHRNRLWEPEIPEWLDSDFLQRINLKARFNNRIHELQGYPLSTQLDTIVIRFASDRVFTSGKYITNSLGMDRRHPFMDRRLINFALQLPPHLKRQPQQAKYILRQAMEGILPDTVRLRKGGVPFSHFRRKGLVQEANYFNEVVSNPLLAQLGFVNLKQWEEELTRYKLGIVDTWNIFRTPIQTDSLLSVEVWLRTCLPQFPKAYTRITNPEKRRI